MSIVEVARRISSNYGQFFLSIVSYRSEENKMNRSLGDRSGEKLTFSIRIFFILPSFFKRFRFSSKQENHR